MAFLIGKKKNSYWFVIGILYILIWETICCFSYSTKEIEREKQIYRDISKSIFQNLEALSGGSQENGNHNEDDTIYIDKFEDEDKEKSGIDLDSGDIKPKTTTSIKKTTPINKKIIPDLRELLPPLNLTFDVKNSSMNIPTYVNTDSFSLSDININSTHFGMQSDNIKMNISVEANQFPISMNLISNKSDVPISLGIYGANNIPVNLIVSSLDTPALNYLVIFVFGSINFILVVFVVTQQISICKLKKRLDAIDISNQVLKGKRFKKGMFGIHR
ncbi:hypothetical protein DICPUDRAFT_78719 [Dictyostelium purpureum]|uniref:Uncharacterized protein n=1 Tax=Dictyostelium purpureum TaxID=5786 RepID=F0ZKC7_DICPU|nr:uncharacterized protein DICPUDRAFT_78719 [Dictyostelium purpureum]EGC35588.1 hypothetical protein DICPUDRAFT_78719 [Dictyostelium purpureum]|eukprot:XP_003287891.1 hypothetical protein DICPUDRAFT_78719 [Dictyostelium purpureum]